MVHSNSPCNTSAFRVENWRMPRTNRYIESGKPYELCLRVREGLPFPCLLFIKLLLESAMARAARGRRVTICHYLWMANHLHILVVLRDGFEATKFYGELQKRLTDYMKRVLGLKRLSLWEGRPMVARILDPETAVWRISYLYANPARADLVTRIDDYPGLSSWKAFLKAKNFRSSFVSKVPWIKAPAIKKVGSRCISKKEDRSLEQELRERTKKWSLLVIRPNAWMACLDVNPSELQRLNESCLAKIRQAEKDAKASREAKGKLPLGAALLREAKIMRPHSPEKSERKIFVLSTDKEQRVNYIEKVKALLGKCRDLFLKGIFSGWPGGVFRPSQRMFASALCLM